MARVEQLCSGHACGSQSRVAIPPDSPRAGLATFRTETRDHHIPVSEHSMHTRLGIQLPICRHPLTLLLLGSTVALISVTPDALAAQRADVPHARLAPVRMRLLPDDTTDACEAGRSTGAYPYLGQRYSGERACELRELRLTPRQGRLSVDAAKFGSVKVEAWDQPYVLIHALVFAISSTRAQAQADAARVEILTDGDSIRAKLPVPDRAEAWSAVNYRVLVPRALELSLRTTNGNVSVSGVQGHTVVTADNGNLVLRDVSGEFRGHTNNGNLDVVLRGTEPSVARSTAALSLRTNNGNVRISLPQKYGATLTAASANGVVSIDPVFGNFTPGVKRVSFQIGSGSIPLGLETTNGWVSVRALP